MEEMGSGHPMHEAAACILEAGQRAASLTRCLLAFSRRQFLQLKLFDVNEEIAGLVTKLLRRLIRDDIAINVSTCKDGCMVNVDPTMFQQMIMNLVLNAQDAMPQGGSIMIETRITELSKEYAATHSEVAEGTYVEIAVSDTGEGMEQETTKRVFEPFFTTKEKGKGTGLGLSTVYGLVKQHGGHVSVYSELGQGSVFRLYLPLTNQKKSLEEVKPEPMGILKGGGRAVLVVEDHDLIRDLTRKIIEKHGFEVFEVSCPQEALEFVETYQGKLDLLLTDILMPGMLGTQLAEKLVERFPGMVVVFMSGYAENGFVKKGVLRPGVWFVSKPFTEASLISCISESLGSEKANKGWV
jgi:two-component system cell cycle sensor histidine kinase/response regulator CckA